MKNTFISFIRGINVGGNNIIKMADLRDALHDEGFEDATTYIQTGNIILKSKKLKGKINKEIEDIFQKHFQIDIRAVTFTEKEWEDIIKNAPKDWGKNKDWKHNLLIMLESKKAKQVLTDVGEIKKELESASLGKGVIYQSVSREKFGQSRFCRLASMPIYKEMTIRNYNTSMKLLALMKKEN